MKKITTFVLVMITSLFISSCQKATNPTTKMSDSPLKSTTRQIAESKIKNETPEGSDWLGKWVRVGSRLYYYSEIDIIKASQSDFQFEINANNGAHIGNVSGTAKIDGKKALYLDEDTKAKVVFSLQNEILTVEYPDEFNTNFGYAVDCKGDYKKGLKATEPTLEEVGILDAKQEEEFKTLVGKDYHLFLETLSLTGEDDLDKIGAKVHSGYARGLHGEADSIIMICENNKFNAAVVDGDVVKYFSNIKAFKNKLPKTIEKWREDFKLKKVMFISK